MIVNSYNNNPTFGQLVSTPLLLRAGSGKIKFEDAKSLNNEIGILTSGHISFYKRALAIAKQASEGDKSLGVIFEELKKVPAENLEKKVNEYTALLGEKIDIKV